MRVAVIGNPSAGSGKAASRLQAFVRGLEARGARVSTLQTDSRGHATQLARQALHACDVLAVVGGDGTLHEVCQAWFDQEGKPVASPPALSLLPSGTGGDAARTLGLDDSLEAAIERTCAGRAQSLDLGVVRLHANGEQEQGRAFVNIASFGLSSWGARAAEEGPKWLGGKASYMYAAFKSALQYKNVAVEVLVDGNPWYRGLALSVVIANGRYFGGGMQVAPEARIDSGLFEVVCIGDVRLMEFARVFPKVYGGKHMSLSSVRRTTAQRVQVSAVRPDSFSEVETDGETPGYLPLDAHIVPAAARILL